MMKSSFFSQKKSMFSDDYLKDDVVPEVLAEHLLNETDHGAEGGRHSIVLLLERQHEDVDGIDLVPENGNLKERIKE